MNPPKVRTAILALALALGIALSGISMTAYAQEPPTDGQEAGESGPDDDGPEESPTNDPDGEEPGPAVEGGEATPAEPEAEPAVRAAGGPLFSPTRAAVEINLSTLDTVQSGNGWSVSGGVVSLNGPDPYTITGSTEQYGVRVDTGGTVQVTLDGASINLSGTPNRAAFDCGSSAVEITLSGANTLQSGSNRAGLQCVSGASVTIDGGGGDSLTATGGSNSAGIGGNYAGFQHAGSITIHGGTITANGGGGGAAIGGGMSGNAGAITITGGTVSATAQSGHGGAAIGGGNNSSIGGNGGTVKITGGVVDATGSGDANDIGSGRNSTIGGSLTVEGGAEVNLNGSGTNANIDPPNGFYNCTIGGAGAVAQNIDGVYVDIDLYALSGTPSAYGWNFANGVLNITENAHYTVTTGGQQTGNRIAVGNGLTVDLTLDRVDITAPSGSALQSGSDLSIALAGDNRLGGTGGIRCTGDVTVTGGTLDLEGSNQTAAMTIDGGTLVSHADDWSAGDLTVSSGGVLDIGVRGTIDAHTLIFRSGSTLRVDADGATGNEITLLQAVTAGGLDDVAVELYGTNAANYAGAVLVHEGGALKLRKADAGGSGGGAVVGSGSSRSSRSSDRGGSGATAPSGTSSGKRSENVQHLGGYSWRVDLPLLGFLSATVDGDVLAKGEDYTVRSGSTVLTLTDSYVSGLWSGSHTLRMEFLSATASIDFTVTPTGAGGGNAGEPGAPTLTASTNDNRNPSTGGVEAAGSIAVLLAVVGLWAARPRKMGK